jgi:PAS domain S-box-containing protein
LQNAHEIMDTEFLKRQLRILHLEDNEKDHFLVSELLRVNNLHCEFTVAKSQDQFTDALKRADYDLILSDFTLPSYDGLSALSVAQSLRPQTPFIFFSGTIGEDVAVESLKNGATDYVLKQRPHRLVAAIYRALRNVSQRSKLQRAEGALQQSEERFRIVTRATNDIIWEWDVQKDKVVFSENFQTTFGHYTGEKGITSEHWFSFIHPDDRNNVVSGISALLANGGRVWWSEHRTRRADGSYAHILDRASVIYDAAGKPSRMVGVKIDMTERKHFEEKIREQAALLDKAQDGIIVCDLDRSISYWNKGAEQIYGWSAREVMGKNVRQLFFREDIPPQINEATKRLNERSEWNGELPEFTKDGKRVIVESRATLIRDEKGNPKSLLLINTDITERKQLEEQFLRSQRLESLGVLISGIAHDLNNTLAPILIGVSMLRSETVPKEEMASILATLETSAQRGSEMVKHVLAFARGGESAKALIPVDKLIKEVGKIIADTFPKSIHCRLQISGTPWPILGSLTQLHQVLMNLCVNARDAMPDGGTLTLGTKNIALTADQAARHNDIEPGNYLCISVMDTGTGISAEARDKIFDPFFTTKAPGKGTGLGLSTSLAIIKNHGGFMTVDSKVGHGTEFNFYLPAMTTSAETDTVLLRSSLPNGNGECILIIDDEEAILAITRSALENYGYRVLSANGGVEAIALFAEKQKEIDLIITDLNMPFMNGNVIIAALRKIRPGIKIIVATGSDQEKFAAPEDPVKVEAFIRKPFTMEQLITTVHQLFAQKK